MFVAMKAYEGWEVRGIDAPVAPNAACCSDPRVLCPRCAMKMLSGLGFTANALEPKPEADDWLPPPEPVVRGQTTRPLNDELLPLPKMQFDQGGNTPEPSRGSEDGDILLPRAG